MPLPLHFAAAPSSKRTSIELAWAVKNSAFAKVTMDRHCCSRFYREYSKMLMDFRKLSTDSGEKNRAVPEVGSTWFGPAI